jgi:predicted MFS family arabinose efflux permease
MAMTRAAWAATFAAAALMGIVLGGRSAYGLFVSPLNTATGMGLAALSFAMALGQLGLGFAQPMVGTLADRFGAARVVAAGAIALALTTAVPALSSLPWAVSLALVFSAVFGSAVASNGLLVGEVTRRVPAAQAGLAIGIVGAGASAGQLVLGPVTQWGIANWGWAHALIATSALSLVALPLAWALRQPLKKSSAAPDTSVAKTDASVSDVLRDWRFWRVAGSFGACGFHIAFLAVHMPGVIERCGLPASLAGTWIALAGAANIAGSIGIGIAMRHRDAAWLLSGLYLVRASAIAALLLAPVSAVGMLLFAVFMGASHMATLPPTAQLVARQHGTARMGTLFGVVMLVHQAGSFAGIWLGGWAAQRTGSDTLLWCVDIVLALIAGALVLPWRRSGSLHQQLANRPA